MKLKIKKNDTVRVITGEDKGKEGKVIEVIAKDARVIVEGVNIISKHVKPNAKNPQGGIVKKEAPIHISNVMFLDGGKTTKVGRKLEGDKIVRYAKNSGEVIK